MTTLTGEAAISRKKPPELNISVPDPNETPISLPGTEQCPACGSLVDTFADGTFTPHAVVVTCAVRGVTSATAIGGRPVVVVQEQLTCPGAADGAETMLRLHLATWMAAQT